MKKKTLLLILLIILTSGCNKIKSYDEIDYEEYSNMIDKKEDFILYVGSSECSHCKDFTPTLKSTIKKYQLDIKYIDVSKLNEKEYLIVKNKTKIQGTPTIVFIHKGIVDSGAVNKVQGAVSSQQLIDKLKDKGYIE